MKSWHLEGLGAGLDGLRLRERDIPQPGPREVLVRVHAWSLNSGRAKVGFQPETKKPGTFRCRA